MVPGCNHTYCLKCLEKLVSQYYGEFPCPECRAEIEIPVGGVSVFQTNRFLRPADLQRARDGTVCDVHPKMEQDTYSIDCNAFICPKCALKDHSLHTTKEIQEAAEDAKDQIKLDLKRLQEKVSYMTAEVETKKGKQKAVDAETKDLETAIHRKHAELMAMADKYRDETLASLRNTRDTLQECVTEGLKLNERNVNKLRQLQQQAPQAVSKHSARQLLEFAKELKDGIGRSRSVQILETLRSQDKTFARPVLTFKVSEYVGRKRVEEFMLGRVDTVSMESTLPFFAVKQRFKIKVDNASEEDIDVFSLCPCDDGNVWVSYAQKGLDRDSLHNYDDLYSFDGKRIGYYLLSKGKRSSKATRNGVSSDISYKDGDRVNTFSKSPALSSTLIKLKHNISSATSEITEVTVVSDNPYKTKQKRLFKIRQSRPQRAFDVDSSQQLFVVLEDTQAPEKRRVHLYLRDQEKAVATYTPPSPYCQPSDICFMTLGGQEILLVADEVTQSIHVVRVKRSSLTFLSYLATTKPLSAPPTALNVDFEGRLWVACRGGTILTIDVLNVYLVDGDADDDSDDDEDSYAS